MNYYISFATDEKSLGACLVEAEDHAKALIKSAKLGINPGGEAMIFELPTDETEDLDFNRLYSEGELKRMGKMKMNQLTEGEQKRFDEHPGIVTICDDCNFPKRN